MSADVKSTFWETSVIPLFKQVVLPMGAETIRLLPDSVVFGTAILALVSLCQPFGVLLMTMVETMMIQRLAAGFIGGITPILGGPGANQMVCQPGFVFGNSQRISLLETIGKESVFPSPVMFFMATILSYMMACVQEFSREITTLGSDLHGRTITASVLSIGLLIGILAFRYSYQCEGFGTLFVSMLFGALLGYALVQQNKGIFGRSAVNILNLPMITAASQSAPMYVCAP
jgi:hypothetical protein